MVLPQFATKNHTTTLSLVPSPWWDEEGNQKEKSKNSCTGMRTVEENDKGRRKQQSIILIKSIYNLQCSHHLMLSLLLSIKKPLPQPAAPLNTEHDITWYRISHLIGCLGQPNQLLVKINSVPTESRTIVLAGVVYA